MKKLSLLLICVATGLLLSTSCSDDTTYADPTISFQNGTNSLVFTGTNSIDVNITFAAEGKIESITMVSPTTTGIQTEDITNKMGQSYSTNARGETSAIYFFKVSTSDLATLLAANNGTLTYKFTLKDKEAKETTAIFTVTTPGTTTPLSVTKTGQFYHIAGLLAGAYNLEGDAEVPVNGTASTKFMVNTDTAGGTFTGSWKSDPQNGTEFVKANSYDFANATEEAAIVAFTAGTPSNTVTNPVADDIYIAKKGTTYYAIKITSVNPSYNTGTGGNTGKITFSYKKKS